MNLFIGANCLLENNGNRVSTAIDVAEELSKLADRLVALAEKDVIIGLTPRFTQTKRTAAVNRILGEKAKPSKCIFCGIAHKISINLLQDDQVHLTDLGLSQIRSILKTRFYIQNFQRPSTTQVTRQLSPAENAVTVVCRDHKSGESCYTSFPQMLSWVS